MREVRLGDHDVPALNKYGMLLGQVLKTQLHPAGVRALVRWPDGTEGWFFGIMTR